MKLQVGTSGYSYKEWKGAFYPEDLPASAMLRFYGERFAAVEINNTFYRMPNKEMLSKWAGEVPERFTFVLKASQRITHQKRLKEAKSDVDYFYSNATVLGDRLGPTFFQLPPYARKEPERLAEFLELIPADKKVAFEFRHASWFGEDVLAVLRQKNAALCFSDDEESALQTELVSTADFGYLRLRRCDYDDPALEVWAKKILAQPWSEAYVFFKHEDEATGPRVAQRFIEVVSRLSSAVPAS